MPEFSPNVLALTDDAYDRENASDGRSRFGAYLDQHAHWFNEDGYPLEPGEFAAAAWRLATSPVMSPGYVRIRPDLANVTPHLTDDRALFLRVEVPLRQSVLASRPAGLADWTRERPTPWDTGTWPTLVEPYQLGRPALLTAATLLLPFPHEYLIEPAAKGPGRRLLIEAKDTVHTLIGFLNDCAWIINDLIAGGAR
ncbi:hypothetical protein [Kitasatospora kifunensis]|uniref:Uncharacterized protein n=1 Tax=Kitasatospora kifunensis TaxID=58351 RepID=A0A7W7R3P4_KITKI|nr:hypothetical protein [Kitasatospora kifunensis]MBB4924786.1 hypothetical protein [Kitasatospora kifunensis]